MELVEGEDFSQRIARLRAPGASARQAGMPLDEALPIAKQIAVAPDDRFLVNTVLDEAAAPITLLQHWRPERK
jgi:hypothetical protein